MDLSHLCPSLVIFKCKLKHVILLYPIELPTSYRIKFKCFCIAYKVHHLQLSNSSNSLFVIIFQYFYYLLKFSSVQLSHSVVSDSLRPHESQHARPPCPSPLPEFTQTHAHRVHDAIQPSHPLSSPSPSSPSPSAPNPCQHQSLFQWVNSSHEVAKVPEFQL